MSLTGLRTGGALPRRRIDRYRLSYFKLTLVSLGLVLEDAKECLNNRK